jgi:hypothetical protein
MYCIKCGVRLEDNQKECPLCKTRVYHPDLEMNHAPSTYPKDVYPVEKMSAQGIMIIILSAFIVAAVTIVLCDLRFSVNMWSGYVVGAMILAYCTCILPFWFKKPNPVIFVPSSFGGVILYLLYVCILTGGKWFLPFAFPVTGALCLIVTAAVTLTRYIRGGRLYIFGGMLIAFGGLALLVEMLLNLTFPSLKFIFWSLYPLVSLSLLGLMLIFLAIYPPAREKMERKFFI